MDLLRLTVLGSFLALDGTGAGQFMVSRPLVAGTLAGWVLGDPSLGLLMGGILELYFIAVFPVGGGEFPEGGPPSLVAVAAAAALPGPGGVALGTLLGLLWSRAGYLTTMALRRVNGRLVPDPTAGGVLPGSVARAHLAALGLDGFRGGVLTLAGLGLIGWLAPRLDGLWPLGWAPTLAVLILGASLPVGAMVGALGGWRRRGIQFGLGLGAALLGSALL